MTPRPSLLFYCQHSLGMGHLMRSLALARALTAHFVVTLVSGGELPTGARVPAGVRVVQLPPVGHDERGVMVSRVPGCSLERAFAARRCLLTETWRSLRADVLILELFPFGRRKFLDELRPMLEESRLTRTLVYCSLRDLLVSRHDRQRQHDEWAAAVLGRYFDGVLVHSDPRFSRLEDSFTADVALPVPLTYTGFVHDATLAVDSAPRVTPGSIVVSAGGGLVGTPLFEAVIAGHALLPRTERRRLTVIGGPFLPPSDWDHLQRVAAPHEDVTLLRAVANLPLELRHAAGSISQCGYNTAMDLVSTGVPALVVPFGGDGEDEQVKRARRLEALGLLHVLLPAHATPARMAEHIRTLPSRRPAQATLDLCGTVRSAELLAQAIQTGPRLAEVMS